MRPPAALMRRIGHTFASPELALAALTHRSAGGRHNERLEFLGDALLDLVISERLYALRPDASEGDLSRLRASLVKRESLARIASELELSDFLVMGPGELKSGGYRRDSIRADALEALLGAVLLDGGYEAARACVLRLFAGRLADLPDAAVLRDPKTRLQERLQAGGRERPSYGVETIGGEAHERVFRVTCSLPALGLRTRGEGTSRRRAEQAAAQEMLERLERHDTAAGDEP